MKRTILAISLLIFGLSLAGHEAKANQELIVNSEKSFNPTFKNRYSFLLGLNPNLTRSTDITNLSFSYGKEFEDLWLDSNFAITRGLFKKITTNNPAATDKSKADIQESTSLMTTFGLGVGRTSHYAQSLLPFSNLYEFISANITYNFYKESTSNKFFYGPGLLAKCSLYKKFSDYFSAGTLLTYNLAVVKRAQDNDNETSSARSLTMSFVTVGFDLSFFL